MKEKMLLERIVKKTSFLALFMFLISTLGFANGPKVLKVKGFYIGMTQQEACNEIGKNVGSTECNIGASPLNEQNLVMSSADNPPIRGQVLDAYIRIFLDKNTRKVCAISIPLKNFGAEEIIFKEFTKQFVDKYNIPEMKGTLNNNGQLDYLYKDPNGYAVVITREPLMTSVPIVMITEIAKANNLNFD